jgi:hypothetical protein
MWIVQMILEQSYCLLACSVFGLEVNGAHQVQVYTDVNLLGENLSVISRNTEVVDEIN